MTPNHALLRLAPWCLAAPLLAPASPQGAGSPSLGDATIVVPQHHPVPVTAAAAASALEMNAVGARIAIHERVASTELLLSLRNPAAAAREAVVLIPVPEGVTVRSFDYEAIPDGTGAAPAPPAGGAQPSARLMPADEARRTYESIVLRSRDPGLLEFANYMAIRSSVFPVPALGRLRVRVRYDQILEADGARIDYFLPRSEAREAHGAEWTITATISDARGIQTIYSPSHRLKITPASEEGAVVEIDPDDKGEAGSFQLSYLPRSGAMEASFLSYPDPKAGGGYFLLLSGAPGPSKKGGISRIPREVLVAIDRSGSMAGPKMEQAREAAREIVEGLEPGEAFNIIDYSSTVSTFAPAPVRKDEKTIGEAREYLKSLHAGGGTNIYDALQEAMREGATPGAYSLVVLLTDGLPTVSKTSELEIREDTAKANERNRRILSVGVGYDVNAPLLDALANTSRGWSVFVHPQENLEVKLGQALKKLEVPVLARPRVECLDEKGEVTTRRVRDWMPGEIPDLFANDPVVLLGRYLGDEPIRFRLSGEARDGARSYEFTFDPKKTARHEPAVARLWAARRISTLIDGVRMAGAAGAKGLPNDPKTKETVDEIIELSTRFGVLSQYTSFFASDPVDLSQKDIVHARLRTILASRAQGERTGQGAVAQSVEIQRNRRQLQAASAGRVLDANLRETRLANIEQRNDRALFRRGVTWVDSQVFERESGKGAADPPDAVIEFGTPQYFELARKLAAENRAGVLAVNGQLLLLMEGKRILVKGPA